MGYEIVDQSGGVLTFRITGTLNYSEFKEGQERAAKLIQEQGKTKFLVLIEDYHGTEKQGDWGDVSFQAKFDPLIEKIALVGDKQWKDLALLFAGKGIRRVPIEYFATNDLPKAKAWLAEP